MDNTSYYSHKTIGQTEMQAALKMNVLEENYYEITELYDLAEELVNTVESDQVKDQRAQMELVEPLIDEVEAATDLLTEEYMTIVETGKPRQSNKRVEGALRRIYVAIDAYQKRADAMAEKAANGIRNLADPIVKKLVRQLETVVAMLVDFVELSLDRIMSHSYADELRKRQEKIAMLLSSLSPSAT